MYIFCLDVGGTRTRGALFDKTGAELARASADGGALSLGVVRSREAIEAVWHDVLEATNRVDIRQEDTRLLAGVAGYNLPGRCAALREELSDFADVYITGDGYGALLAATGGKPGALISVGTGVAALRLDSAGKALGLSGWGFPAGDHGSGAWLGLQLVGDLTKHLDGIGMDPPFPAGIVDDITKITGETANQIMDWHCTGKASRFGSLAPLIVSHATAGNAYCLQMLKRSAAEIVGIAGALYPEGAGDVFLGGGLGPILKPYCISAAPSFNWQETKGDPLLGLLTIETANAPRENLLPRPGYAPLD